MTKIKSRQQRPLANYDADRGQKKEQMKTQENGKKGQISRKPRSLSTSIDETK